VKCIERKPYIRRPILQSVSATSRVLPNDIGNQSRGGRSIERRNAAQEESEQGDEPDPTDEAKRERHRRCQTESEEQGVATPDLIR
jgi:hypothetical protein